MTGRALDLTQRQIRALCAGARKEGFVPVLKIGKVEVRLIPEDRAIPAEPDNDIEREEDFAL